MINEPNFFDIDLERSILSAILYNEENIDEISNFITPSDFYQKSHQDIFEAMLNCLNNNQPLDQVFITKKLANKYDEEAFGEVLSTSPIIDITKYATELKENSIKRSLIKIAQNIPKKVSEDNSAKNIVDDISQKLYSLIDNEKNGTMKEIRDLIVEMTNEIKKQKQRIDQDIIGLDTGFRYLNEYTKGFKPGDLIIIAARPGMGKTALVLNMILKNLKQDKGVVLFSLEMPGEQILMRMASVHTSIPLSNIMTGKMTDQNYTDLNSACEAFSKFKFFVYDSGYVNINQVKTALRKLKAAHNEIDLCVIDYIGLMTSTSNFSERHLQIAEISRGLKLLARELSIPIIALSQLNRGLENRSNKRPLLSDLRESGAIEQDADVILFVYQNDIYLEQARKEKEEQAKLNNDYNENNFNVETNKIEGEAEIIIGKNRNGELGTVKVYYQKKFTRFVDSTSQPEISQHTSDNKPEETQLEG